ncbi:MAG: ribonuclease Z [Bacteroidetes bacterium]|jgi:ribonuclease Z|nr:ribonuclease Z [Bacteroidota bacterium]
MSIFSVTILGSSSALPTSERFPTAHVLHAHERFFLIDCGEGTQLQLRKYKIKLSRLSHIFISHLHGDHVFGIFGLLSTLNLLGRKNDLHIFAHKDFRNILGFYLNNFGHDLRYNIHHHLINTKKAEKIWESKTLEVETIPLIHRVPTCGFLFKEKEWRRNIIKEKISEYNLSIKQINELKQGNDLEMPSGKTIPGGKLTWPPYKSRSYAYCSDTRYHEEMISQIKGIDLLYHEATFTEQDSQLAYTTWHSTAGQAAKIAREANVKHLLLGHFSARYKKEDDFINEARTIFSNTSLVNDGDEYKIPLERDGNLLENT